MTPPAGSAGTAGAAADAIWLVVGLGNPGPRYEATRHNVGQHVVDEVARRTGGRFSASPRGKAVVLEGRLGVLPGGRPGPRVVLAKPGSWMNESGGPVSALAQYYRVDLDHLLVVHDELDLPLGTVRLKQGGGEGGHNGLRSVSGSLGTKDYVRLRIGIGRPPGRQDPADFVLEPFAKRERDEVAFALVDAADAVEDLVTAGLLPAQQRLHAPG